MVDMTKPLALAVCFLIFAAFWLVAVPSVKGQSRTITVPDEYPSISVAIANAQDEDTIFVKNGTYNESSLVIDKSIRLIGEDKNSTVISIRPKPIQLTGHIRLPPFTEDIPITMTVYEKIVTIIAPNVTVSGFTIKSQIFWSEISIMGNGTQITDNKIDGGITGAGNWLQILNNSFADGISLSGSNLTIAQNIVADAVWCYGSYNVVFSNQVRKPYQAVTMDDDTYGPWFSISVGSFALVVNNTINAGGLALGGNGSVAAQNTVRSSVWVNGSDQTVCANNITHGGLIVTGNNNTLYANNVTGYSKNSPRYYQLHKIDMTEIQAAPYALSMGRSNDSVDYKVTGENYANNTFYHNNFNGTILRLWDGVSGPNFWSTAGQGNYWSNYRGTDADGDGIGDTPYLMDTRDSEYKPLNGTEIVDSHPLIAPFNGTAYIELPTWAPSFVAALVPTPTPTRTPTEVSQPNQAVYIAVGVGTIIIIACAALLFFVKKRRLT